MIRPQLEASGMLSAVTRSPPAACLVPALGKTDRAGTVTR
jgi:hypothetical protein